MLCSTVLNNTTQEYQDTLPSQTKGITQYRGDIPPRRAYIDAVLPGDVHRFPGDDESRLVSVVPSRLDKRSIQIRLLDHYALVLRITDFAS